MTSQSEPTVRQLIKDTVSKMSQRFPDEDPKKHEELLIKIFEEGKSPKEAMGFDDKFMEHLYADGYRLFQSGNYEDAKQIFLFLMKLNPSESKYAYGVGSCFQKQEEWQYAINAYMACMVADLSSPLPLFHVADCLLRLNSPSEALIVLKSAVDLANKPEHSALKQRAEMMIESLTNDLNKNKPEIDASQPNK